MFHNTHPGTSHISNATCNWYLPMGQWSSPLLPIPASRAVSLSLPLTSPEAHNNSYNKQVLSQRTWKRNQEWLLLHAANKHIEGHEKGPEVKLQSLLSLSSPEPRGNKMGYQQECHDQQENAQLLVSERSLLHISHVNRNKGQSDVSMVCRGALSGMWLR